MKCLMKKGCLNRDFESNVESLEQLMDLFNNTIFKIGAKPLLSSL